MLENRFLKIAIILWWLASLGWLVHSKLFPLSRENAVPVQRFLGPGTDAGPAVITWNIEYKSKSVGSSRMEIRPNIAGSEIHSQLELSRLPLHEMMQDASAILPFIAKLNGISQNNMYMSLQISTRMDIDAFGDFERIESRVRFADLGELFQVRAVRLGPDKVDLVVTPGEDLPDPWQSKGELLRQPLKIPKNTFMSDMFSPAGSLENLRVGQTWTVQSLRPFPGNRPLRELQAKVEREEIVPWAGDAEPAFLVTLRDNDPVLVALAEPTIEMWVLRGGMVVRQRLRLGNLEIDFVRREERPGP